MNRFGGALSSDAITDLLREFAPDMKRLFRKHAPKKILKIEEKLPIPPEDSPKLKMIASRSPCEDCLQNRRAKQSKECGCARATRLEFPLILLFRRFHSTRPHDESLCFKQTCAVCPLFPQEEH